MVPLKFGKLWAGNNAKNIRGKPDISNKCFIHYPAGDMQKITFENLIVEAGQQWFCLSIAYLIYSKMLAFQFVFNTLKPVISAMYMELKN